MRIALPIVVLVGAALAGSPIHAEENGRAELEREVAYGLSLSDEAWLRLIPKQSRGIFWTTCPHCKVRTRTARWKWVPEQPEAITCEDCGTRFPDPRYPEDHEVSVAAPGGKVHRLPYYLEARAGSRKSRQKSAIQYFLSTTADYFSRQYVVKQTERLAALYRITREERLARRIALTLEEFATVYPGYPFIYDGSWHGKPVEFHPYNEPLVKPGYQPSRWEYWGYMDLSRELLDAYAAIATWPGWSGQERVKEHLFQAQVRDVSRFAETYHNMSVAQKWPSLFRAARILRDPALFHDTYGKLKRFMVQDFLYDGSWKETSPSYAAMTLGGLTRIGEEISGYSDPEGYRDPTSGARFDNLDFDRDFPEAAALRETLLAARFPDGRYLPINDTWGRGAARPPSPLSTPEARLKSALFPGLGVALLQTEAGAPFAAYLNFTSGVMHKQFDTLSIGLHAQEKEYLSTIGYTHTRYRPWAKSAVSKNTVIVDGREPAMDPKHVGNELLLFAGDGALLRLAAARSRSAYPGVLYQRHLALVGAKGESPFLIDLFHVRGGRQHDYLLHGSVDEDNTASLEETALKPFDGTLMNPGARFVPPVIESSRIGPEGGYGFVRHLQRAEAEGNRNGTALLFRYAQPDRGLRSLLLPAKGDQLFLGEAPSIRRAGGRHFKEDESLLDRYLAPMLCWRRSGDGLESTFIAVHQLLKEPPLKVERLASDGHVVLLRLDGGKRGLDYYLQRLEPGPRLQVTTPDGLLTFEGEVGFLRLKNGVLREARLVGRGVLQLGDAVLEQSEGEAQGEIVDFGAMSQPFLDIREPVALPPGQHAIRLAFADGTERSFNLLKAEPHSDGTRLFVREKAGFERQEGKIVFTSFPQREVIGSRITYSLFLMKTKSWPEAPQD